MHSYKEKKDSGCLMIVIVAIKITIVLCHLELPWILIPRRLKYKGASNVGYYSVSGLGWDK